MSMKKYIKIQDHEFLVKDPHSKAILNTDLAAARRHTERFAKVTKELKRDADINQLQNDVQSIKSDLSTILDLLRARA